jgi:predicted ferric reductase
MTSNVTKNTAWDEMLPVMTWQNVLVMLMAVVIGAFAAIVVLPSWIPALTASLSGESPKVYWHLSRSMAFVAFGLLWLSMVFGLLISSKLAPLWPGGPTAFELHQHTGLLGLAFALFHGLILLGDHYMGYTLVQILVPFTGTNYRPQWVGLGQVGLYLMMLVGLSVYVRQWIGKRMWRLIHFLSFMLFGLALVHGLGSGTDSSTVWAQGLYAFSGISVLGLLVYRILKTVRQSGTS